MTSSPNNVTSTFLPYNGPAMIRQHKKSAISLLWIHANFVDTNFRS
jgi:hypothetical protein